MAVINAGDVIAGKYRVERVLGIGGMGEVYLAERADQQFEQRVAIKVVRPQLADSHATVAMFLDEARLGMRLNHPNLITIYDFGQGNGSYFIAMEYVSGKDMRAMFDRCRKRGKGCGAHAPPPAW